MIASFANSSSLSLPIISLGSMYERAMPVQIRARRRDILPGRRGSDLGQNTATIAFIRLKSHTRCRRSRNTVGGSFSSEQLHVRFPNSQPKPVPCWLPPTLAHAVSPSQAPAADGGAAACGTHAHPSHAGDAACRAGMSPLPLPTRRAVLDPSAWPFKPVATAAPDAPGRHIRAVASRGLCSSIRGGVFAAPSHRPVTAPADSGGT